MSRILKIARFHLSNLFYTQTFIFAGVIVLNILISLAVTNSVENSTTAGSIDPIGMVWIFILGITFFSDSFKYLISNGVSRRRFFYSSVLSLAALAALWSVLIVFFVGISRLFTDLWVVFELLYRGQGVWSMLLWEFAILFMLAVLGWFFCLIYYVSSRRTRSLITVAPFILGPLLVLSNIMTEGRVFDALGRFIITSMGFGSSTPNPFIAILSLLIAAAVLCGANFLLVRRAQIRD